MSSISNLPKNQKQQLWISLHEIAEYNKRHFFGNDFKNMIINEYKEVLLTESLYTDEELTNFIKARQEKRKVFRDKDHELFNDVMSLDNYNDKIKEINDDKPYIKHSFF